MEALAQRAEVTGVYVVGAQGEVGLRDVRTGTPGADGRVPVLAGLAAGERIAADPQAAAVALKQQPAGATAGP